MFSESIRAFLPLTFLQGIWMWGVVCRKWGEVCKLRGMVYGVQVNCGRLTRKRENDISSSIAWLICSISS